jgi:hypothetical protein
MKHIILCDLDGTLADCSHRLHHIQPPQYRHGVGEQTHPKKNWTAFFAACGDDSPIPHIISFIEMLDRDRVEVWITSGRSDECRSKTESWLADHGVRYDRLIMRRAGDFTDDGILKPSWLTDGAIPRDRVLLAIDDRNRVVKAWRDAGIPCLQVAEGDF